MVCLTESEVNKLQQPSLAEPCCLAGLFWSLTVTSGLMRKISVQSIYRLGKKQEILARAECYKVHQGTLQNIYTYEDFHQLSRPIYWLLAIVSEVKWKSLSHVRFFVTPWTWNSLGQNTGVGSLSLLQGILPTQGLNPGLLHCKWILYQLRHKGSPRILEWVAYLFSSGSSRPRNQTGVSCIAGGFFTKWAIREALLFWDHSSNMSCPKSNL